MANENELKVFDLAVIGGGGAGVMAFLRSVLNYDCVVLLQGDAKTKKKGRSTWVAEVDNIPGMHAMKRPINTVNASTLKWLDAQEALKDRSTVISGAVVKIEKTGEGFVLHYVKKNEPARVKAKYVILATGIMDVQPKIGGSIDPIFPFANRGDVLYCVRCDGHKTIGKKLSIIGKDDKAIYIGTLMVERYAHPSVAILTNGVRSPFSEKAKDFAKPFPLFFYDDPIVSIEKDEKTSALKGYWLKNGFVETDSTVVALGIIPYNQLLTELGGKIDNEGKAVVSEKYESSIKGFFVVGDLVSGKKMQIYTAWDQAVDAADEINQRLRREKRKNML